MRKRRWLYGSVLSLFVFVGFSSFFSLGMLERAVSYIVYPLLVAQHKLVTPLKSYFQQRRTVTELGRLIAKVQADRDELISENISLHSLLSYALETEELVRYKKRYDDAHMILAQVLMKHYSEQSHYFLLDKGSHDGIEPDMIAVYKNCLLGKVIDVYPYYCKVVLVTDKTCKVAAYCTQTSAGGIHQGVCKENETTLHHVSHLEKLIQHDLVLSSGEGLVFPKGFALGKVKSYESNGLYYAITIEPLLDIRKLAYCYIVKKGTE